MTAMTLRRIFATSITLAVLCAAASPAAAAPRPSKSARAQVLVTFTATADIPGLLRAVETSGGKVLRRYEHVLSGVALDLPEAALPGLLRNPNVVRVERDAVVSTTDTQPSPPSWGLDRVDQRALPLSGSYTYTENGSGVTVYVIDTGVRATHSELSGRVSAGYTSISDGRGTDDCNGHGTHVAGTVAGAEVGIAKAAAIVPVRVLDCTGSGTWSGVLAGLDWVASHHAAGVPAVANMSLGGGASSTIDAAVANLVNDGIVVAVAAGNANVDACTTSPARAASALTVGATTSTDARASYSNFGTCLDLFAPGSSIVSSWYTSDTSRSTLSGTSMAAPHVAGVAARILSSTPSATPDQVSAQLLSNTTTGAITSPGVGSPNRLLYADSQVVAPTPATAPTAPTSVSAVAGKRSAKITWVRGADGGSALTAQIVGVYMKGTKVASVSVSATASSVTLTRLKPGVAYRFSVSAVNAVGSSPESSLSNEVVPRR